MDKLVVAEDFELYSRMKKGDREAFNALFLKYYSVLCAFGKYYVSMEDAEEIVQDIMVWLWENREYQVVEISLRSYLFKSVKNKCLALIDKNQTKRRFCEHMLATEMQGVFEDPDFYIAEELMNQIEKTVSQMPETYRVAFEMSRYQAMTYKEIAEELDQAMNHYASITSKFLHNDYASAEGAGAAGGLGFAFLSYLNATLTPGIDLILNAVELEKELEDTDITVTGEGRLDHQTAMGNAPVGVARLAKKYGSKVVAFAGSVTPEATACNAAGIDAFFPIVRGITTLAEAMDPENAKSNMTAAVEQVFRLL